MEKDYSGGSNELERAQTEPDSTPLPINYMTSIKDPSQKWFHFYRN
ncbi:MAG: hypothetical protein K6C13_05905 [Oscillospiraceae bacterium]|nr:hypothetical protein [Oscillospiraceae bacterium]